MIGFDPLAGLVDRQLTVALAGHTYTIAPAPAAVWLQSWAQYGVDRLMGDRLDTGDRYRYYSDVVKGRCTAAMAAEASRRLFGRAAGCDWWVADRLALQSVAWAGVGGELYAQGLRPDSVPLVVWLGCTYRVLMAAANRKDRAVLESSLTLPPDGYDTGELPNSIDEIFTV